MLLSTGSLLMVCTSYASKHIPILLTGPFLGTSVQIHSFGDALKITAPSHLVEKMLNTRLYKYQHTTKTHMHAIRQVGGFTIPSEISSKIYMITGLTMFPYVRKSTITKLDEELFKVKRETRYN